MVTTASTGVPTETATFGGGVPSETATFGGGCFWGIEAAFRKVVGVLETAVGYMGGTTDHPTYEQVCSNVTGHAEVVQLQFDPKIVSYEQLLRTFWDIHDPTTKDRQGPDVGAQYRSAVFFHSSEQETLAKKVKAELEQAQPRHKGRIVTEIVPASTFWRAEEYHQRYFEKWGGGTCHY